MINETTKALENIQNVMEDTEVPAVTAVDINIANAYLEDAKNSDLMDQTIEELETKAEDVITESPEITEVKEKNIYTRLVLDESVNDFNISFKDLSDESDEDLYLDYDMFDFVYGLVTDDWPRPRNPLGRRMRKFQHTDSDDYIKTNEPTGMSQVATDTNGNVVVYANSENAFTDVREAADYYHLTYSDVKPRMNKDSHWAFNMTIYVPMTADGYPLMAEDFFADYGWSLSDVIEDHKVGGGKSTNWGVTYDKRVEKDRADKLKYQNDKLVDDIFDKFVVKAARSSDPLEKFIKEMFAYLDDQKLEYSKSGLKKRFLAEFEDNFEDEE